MEELSLKDYIIKLHNETGMNRRQFAEHLGIPLRTMEDWEAGRRTPPAYVPRMIEYQLKYERLMAEMQKDQPEAVTESEEGDRA